MAGRMASLLLSWLCRSSLIVTIAATSSSEAPWQSVSGPSVLEEAEYGDQPLIVFWPGGRLHAVERTAAAASSKEDASSNLAVALSCREGIVVVTTSPTSPHLDVASNDEADDEDKTTTSSSLWITTDAKHRAPLSRLTSNAWMVTGGNAVDSSILRAKISRMAEAMQEANDGGQPLPSTRMSCAALARRVSDHLQMLTQTMGKGGRILASYALLAGRDATNTCCLWRIDPTGQFWKCQAACVGRGFAAAEAHLVEVVSDRDMSAFFSDLSWQQAILTACECIEKVLPKENKAYWQAVLLRPGSNGDRANSQVFNGDEILSLLKKASDSAGN